MTKEEATQFFEAYLAAWNAQDFTALCGFYAEPSMFVLSERSILMEDMNGALALMETVFARLNADDFGRSTYESLEAQGCAEGLAVLDVSNVMRLRKDGSLIEKIDAHYVLRHDPDGGWQITTAVVCTPGWRRV